ncbi:MAG: hypothetical protein AAF939_15225 [Planctomycetota bacterium]
MDRCVMMVMISNKSWCFFVTVFAGLTLFFSQGCQRNEKPNDTQSTQSNLSSDTVPVGKSDDNEPSDQNQTQPPPQPEIVEVDRPMVVYNETVFDSLTHHQNRREYEASGVDQFPAFEPDSSESGSLEQAAIFCKRIISGNIDFSSKPKEKWQQLADRFRSFGSVYDDNSPLKTDAVWMLAEGVLAQRLGELEKAKQKFKLALTAFESENHHPVRMQIVTRRFLYQLDTPEPSSSPSDFKDQAADYATVVLNWIKTDLDWNADNHRFVFEDLKFFYDWCLQREQYDTLENFEAEFLLIGNIPKWIRYQFRGYAFLQRHYQFESLVKSGRSRKGIAGSAKKAKDYLEAAFKTQPSFPESSYLLALLAIQADDRQNFDQWFDACTNAQPDYLPIYRLKMNQALVEAQIVDPLNPVAEIPEWKQKFDFAFEEANKSAASDARVLLAIDVIRNLTQSPVSNEQFDNFENAKQKILKFFQDLSAIECVSDGQKAYPQSYFQTIAAIVADRQDWNQLAYDSFSTLGQNFDQQAVQDFSYFMETFEFSSSRVIAFNDEFKKQASEVERFMNLPLEDRLEAELEVRDLCDEVLRKGGSAGGELYFRACLTRLDLESRFHSGEAIEYDFDPTFSLFECQDIRNFSYVSKSSIVVQNQGEPSDYLVRSKIETPGHKIVELDVDFSSELDDPTNSEQEKLTSFPGIAIGYFYPDSQFVVAIGKELKSKNTLIKFGDRQSEEFFEYTLQEDPRFKFHLKVLVLPGLVEVYIDDSFVFRTMNQRIRPLDRLALVNLNGENQNKAVISSLRVKPITRDLQGPVVFTRGDFELRVDLFRQDLFRNEGHRWNCFAFAQTLHQRGDLESAKRTYLESIQLGIPESEIAFYLYLLADQMNDQELKTTWAEKIRLSQDVKFWTITHPDLPVPFSTSQHWARFLVDWQDLQSGLKVSESSIKSARLPQDMAWMKNLLQAQFSATRGEFTKSISLAKSVLKNCTKPQEDVVFQMIEAYKSKRVFVKEPGEPWFYQSGRDNLFFLPTFESYLKFPVADEYLTAPRFDAWDEIHR